MNSSPVTENEALLLYIDCFSGISGDMFLAALLDLGLPEHLLREQLSQLGIDNEFELNISQSDKLGIHGTRVDVIDGSKHQFDHSHHHHGRCYKTIRNLIESSHLQPEVKHLSLTIFHEIALAESEIHHQPVDEVHFHEVGAVDSIVDIVGAAVGIHFLREHRGVTGIWCRGPELGSGWVQCQHGRYPVPAPATEKLLQGLPCHLGGVEGEATTPTGAAILRACVDHFSEQHRLAVCHSAYGIGHRDFTIPNVLRLQLAQRAPEAILQSHLATPAAHCQLQTTIDDMTPEALSALMDNLFESGADDVYFQPVTMKKSRPGIVITVLCIQDLAARLSDLILNQSTSIGLRRTDFVKTELPRQHETLNSSLGSVRIKRVIQPDGRQRCKIEHDDIQTLAQQHQRSYADTKRQLLTEMNLTVFSNEECCYGEI